MPQQIVYSKSVELKLDSIALQIEDRYGLSASNNFLKEFFKMIRHASRFPDLWKIYREDIRFLIIKKMTLIFYKHDGPTMYVVAVFLARENWMNQF